MSSFTPQLKFGGHVVCALLSSLSLLYEMFLSEALFNSGFFHGDLHGGNMLFDYNNNSPPILTLIDFWKCTYCQCPRIVEPVHWNWRQCFHTNCWWNRLSSEAVPWKLPNRYLKQLDGTLLFHCLSALFYSLDRLFCFRTKWKKWQLNLKVKCKNETVAWIWLLFCTGRLHGE